MRAKWVRRLDASREQCEEACELARLAVAQLDLAVAESRAATAELRAAIAEMRREEG